MGARRLYILQKNKQSIQKTRSYNQEESNDLDHSA